MKQFGKQLLTFGKIKERFNHYRYIYIKKKLHIQLKRKSLIIGNRIAKSARINGSLGLFYIEKKTLIQIIKKLNKNLNNSTLSADFMKLE